MEINFAPTPKQFEALEYLKDGTTREVVFGGAAGVAKANWVDSLVSTPFGFKKMGDIKKGDQVNNPDGSISRVIAVHPQGIKELYKVRFVDGAETVVTKDHIWLYWKARSRIKRKFKKRLGTTEELKRITDNTKQNIIIPLTDPVVFTRTTRYKAAKDKIDPYIVGFLLGDGGLTNHITFTTADGAEEIESLLPEGYRVNKAKDKYSYSITYNKRNEKGFCINPLITILESLSMMGKKSGQKEIHESYFTADVKTRLALLQGLMDTDGTVGKSGYLSFTSVSKKLAEGVQYIVRSLGGKASISKNKAGYEKDGLYIPCQDAYTVGITIKNSSELFRLERKKKRCTNGFNGGVSELGRRIVSIEYFKDDYAQCITVDNPNGLYLTDDFIVTHNSYLGCAWLIINCLQYPKTRWLMGRAKLSDLKASTLATFFDITASWKITQLYGYKPQDKIIIFTNGSQICLRDLFLYPADPDFTSLGSTEFTGAFIDEGGDVTEKAKNIVNSRLRYKLNEYNLIPKTLISCNPAKNWLYTQFYKPYKDGTLPERQKAVFALPKDNIHLPKSYIENLENLDDVSRERLLHGNWEYDDTPNRLIDFDAICDMWSSVDVPSTSSGQADRNATMFMTVDVAGDGADLATIMVWEDWVVREIKAFPKITTPLLEDEMAKLCSQYGISRRNVVADKDGVGLGVVQHFRCRGFINNAKSIQPPGASYDAEQKVSYANLKTQCYFMLAEKINNREIKIVPNRYKNELTEELEQVKQKDWDKDTVKKIIPKDEVKANIGRSPDFSDCMAFRLYFELVGYDNGFLRRRKELREQKKSQIVKKNYRQTTY